MKDDNRMYVLIGLTIITLLWAYGTNISLMFEVLKEEMATAMIVVTVFEIIDKGVFTKMKLF